MATSVARPYHTLDLHHLAKSSGRRKCKCCPYGYHIDLDFVRYCESISSSQLLSDIPVRRSRWNVRKRRASKETLLGIAGLTQLEEDTTKASQDVGDDLQRAVLDFEKVLISSSARKSEPRTCGKTKGWQIPKETAQCEEHFKKSITKKQLNQTDETKLPVAFLLHGDFDNFNNHGTNNSIRKQMATSLGRMRELEDEVKLIPNLQAHISNLEKENKRLTDLLQKQEQSKNNRKVESVDASTATSQTNCHTRNVAIGCTIMTRDIGISNSIRTTSCGTDPHNKLLNVDNTDKTSTRPCLISLENILGNSSRSPSRNVATITDRMNKVTKDAVTETELRLKKIFTEDEITKRFLILKKEFEDTMKKNSNNIGVITELRQGQIYTKEDLDRHIENIAKQIYLEKVPVVNATKQTMTDFNPETKDKLSQTAIVATTEMGISAKVQMTDNWVQMVKTTRDAGVSNHTISDPCVNCNVKKINIGTQYVVKDKQVTKYDVSRYTDTSDLTKVKDQGVNTTKRKLVSTGVDVCSFYCGKCSELQSDNNTNVSVQSRPNRPSYLPVPTQSVNKTKTSGSTNSSNRLRNEDYSSDSGSDDGVYNPQTEDSVSRVGNLSTFHPIQPKSYKKEPSKEMKGALKVLNDALQKYSCENFPKHMRNAINIVQQEWFKVSSVADANPLDVEDYLDCFEEISGTLLEYIVNMTDVTGNTAMHYAVSNGNFDVVSILLDSKVCNINKMNTAGYTCIMLVALTKVSSDTHRQVVRRLFQMADVNIRAKQHGQTALMLAVSHGRIDTVELLLESGADINIQDEDGSTALMCAAEHGYIDIVKLLLTQPDCDLTITDYDGSTALAIAMEAGNRDIGVLLYAQEHFSRGGSPFTPSKGHRRAKSATPTLRSGTPVQSPQGDVPR